MDAVLEGGTLRGTIASIPSKSAAHRSLICAALADGPTKIRLLARNEDIDATAACLRELGAKINTEEGVVTVTPICAMPQSANLNCGESGSTLRFLLPLTATLLSEACFSGRGNLPNRPISELNIALEKNGVRFSGNRLPFQVSGRLRAGTYEIEGNISSQYISGLLLALPLLNGDSRIVLKSPVCSEPYVRLTADILLKFGVHSETCDEGYFIRGGQKYHSPSQIDIEGDWSAAAVLLTGGALGGDVTVTGLDIRSMQGDRAIVEILQQFGAELNVSQNAVGVKKAELHACSLDVSSIPDLLPPLAVLACGAKGKTVLYNAAHLRLKESDRLESTAAMINTLGGRASAFPDRLEIEGARLSGGTVLSFGDHRIVMAAAVAAGICEGKTTIIGADVVSKSYPDFFRDYAALGGKMFFQRLEEN